MPPPEVVSELGLGVEVRDQSHLDWIVSIPLPPSGSRRYEIEFSLQIPESIRPKDDVWSQLEVLARLQSPTESLHDTSGVTEVTGLRRETLAVARKLRMLRETIETECRGTRSQDGLDRALAEGIGAVSALRVRLGQLAVLPKSLSVKLGEEPKLVDEFLSHQLYEFLGGAQAAVDASERQPGTPQAAAADAADQFLSRALLAETDYRRAHGWVDPGAGAEALSQFATRATALNEHFQDLLQLDSEMKTLQSAIQPWTAVLGTAAGGAVWVAAQRMPWAQAGGAALSAAKKLQWEAAWGIGGAIVALGFIFALKERLNQFVRGWLTGRMLLVYGQRILKLRLGKRADAKRSIVVESRGRFDCEAERASKDGSIDRSCVLRFHLRGEAHAARALVTTGIQRVKHTFRFNLATITSRLGDTVRKVPIMDPVTKKLVLTSAAKEVQCPLKLEVKMGELQRVATMQLVISKRGVERLLGAPKRDVLAMETLI